MRFLHISDTHFDYMPGLNYLDTNEYISEKFNSLQQAVDYAVENNIKYIVHSGDIFDRIRPNIQYIIRLMKLLHKAEKKGIIFIIVSGNHDQPKIKGLFNSLTALETLDNVYVFTNPDVLTITDNNEKVDFVCIPAPSEWGNFSKNFKNILDSQIEKLKSSKKVLITHIQIANVIDKSTNEVEPFVIDGIQPSEIPEIFNYVALGHVHKMQQIAGRPEMWYAGSSSLLSFGEINQSKYFIDVDISKDKAVVMPIEIKLKYKLVKIEIDAAKTASNEDIEKAIMYYSSDEDIKGNIIKIILSNCTNATLSIIDIQEIIKSLKTKNPLGIKIEIKRKDIDLNELNPAEVLELSESLIKPIDSEVSSYLKSINISNEKIKEILGMNNEVISMYEDKKENK